MCVFFERRNVWKIDEAKEFFLRPGRWKEKIERDLNTLAVHNMPGHTSISSGISRYEPSGFSQFYCEIAWRKFNIYHASPPGEWKLHRVFSEYPPTCMKETSCGERLYSGLGLPNDTRKTP